MRERLRERLARLPRHAFWLMGAAVAIAGALAARIIADEVSIAARPAVWIGGSVFIFLGLAIVSLGGRIAATDDDEDERRRG